LDGYILAPPDTPLDEISGAEGTTWNDLEKEHPLLRQGGDYIGRLFEATL